MDDSRWERNVPSRARLSLQGPRVSPFVGHNLHGKCVPALALTAPIGKSLANALKFTEVYDANMPDFEVQLAQLRTEIEHINEQIMIPRPRVDGSSPNREWAVLRAQRRKGKEQRRILEASRKVFSDRNINGVIDSFHDDLDKKLQRAEWADTTSPGKAEREKFKLLLEDAMRDHDELALPDSDSIAGSSSTEFTQVSLSSGSEPAVLARNLQKAREQYRKRLVDPTGLHSVFLARYKAKELKRAGLSYPPSTVVGQFALIEGAQWRFDLHNARQKCRRIKRRMRAKGMLIEREFEDDTEFSWDVNEDGEGSEPPEEYMRKTRHKVGRWLRSAPNQMASASRVPSAVAPSLSDLRPMELGSQASGAWNFPKDQKRIRMYQKAERQRTRELFGGRTRGIPPSRRTRVYRRKLNSFLLQRPDHFRYTNNEPRHRESSERASDASDRSSHGNFRFWDRASDPTEDGSEGRKRTPSWAKEDHEDGSDFRRAKRARI